MLEQHQRALDQLVELLKPDPDFLAVITAGSIAQGTAKETSDVDVYLVVSDESYAKRKQEHALAYNNPDVCDYSGGYIDGKIIDLRFLKQAAVQGSEPTRYSFTGSEAIFSRITGLEQLISRIPVYPEQNREQNIKDFFAQVFLYAFYFPSEAAKTSNSYLLLHSVSNLALFGSRIVLAYNRMLFPCHKGLQSAVQAAPDKPEHYMSELQDLLANPNVEKCMDFAKMLLGHYQPEMPFEQAVSLFMTNNEWNWLDQSPSITDR